MAVRRIVPNIRAEHVGEARGFYADILGLRVAMDMGWIVTFAADDAGAAPQVSILMEGGSGAPAPDLTVEVDNLEAVHRRAVAAGLPIEYGPSDEPWGVRRFFVRDPFGRLLNIMAHA